MSVAYLGVFVVNREGVPSYYCGAVQHLTAAETASLEWLRLHAPVQAGKVVYVHADKMITYSIIGLPQIWLSNAQAFPTARERVAARERLAHSLPANADAYWNQGVQWFVLGPKDAALSNYAQQWIGQGRARQVWSQDELRIVELLARP